MVFQPNKVQIDEKLLGRGAVLLKLTLIANEYVSFAWNQLLYWLKYTFSTTFSVKTISLYLFHEFFREIKCNFSTLFQSKQLLHSVVISELFPPLQKFFVKLIYRITRLFRGKVNLSEFLQNIVGEKFSNFHSPHYVLHYIFRENKRSH